MQRLAQIVVLCVALLPAQARAQVLTDAELDQWLEFIFEMEQRVERRSDDVQLMVRLVHAYIQVGDIRRVMPAIERLDDLGVDPVRLAIFRGDAHLRVRSFDGAASAYLEALTHAPRQTHALSQLWRLMLEVTLSEASVSFDRAAIIERLQREGLYFPEVYAPEEDGPAEAQALVSRAQARLTSRPEEAAALAIQAISLDPGNATAYAVLGRTYQQMNDPNPAVGAFLVYLQLAPDAQDADEVLEFVGRTIEQAAFR